MYGTALAKLLCRKGGRCSWTFLMFAVDHSEWLNLYVLKCHVIKSILNVQVRMVKRWLLVSSNKFGSVQVRQQKLVQIDTRWDCYGTVGKIRFGRPSLKKTHSTASKGRQRKEQISTSSLRTWGVYVEWWYVGGHGWQSDNVVSLCPMLSIIKMTWFWP